MGEKRRGRVLFSIDIRRATDAEVRFWIGTLENVDESLVFRHHQTEGRADGYSQRYRQSP